MRILIGLLLATQVLSAQWIQQESGTKENLRGLSAVSDKVVWASGTHGTFLRTLDGGEHWTHAQVAGAEQLDFRDVEGFSADLAFLLAAGSGDTSRIYKTTDGGKTWKQLWINQEPKGFFDCMAFWDKTHGIAVGDPVNGKFQLIRTDDGETWKPIPSDKLPPAIDGEGAFAASGTCITTREKKRAWFATGGSAARVFRSTDGGVSWKVADTPIVHGQPSQGIFSVAFDDALRGIVVGGDYKVPEARGINAAYSDDGGATWHAATQQPQLYLSAVAYWPELKAVALGLGTTGQSWTMNAGKEWLGQTPTQIGGNALAMAPVTSKREVFSWRVGQNGAIWRQTRER